MKSTGLYAEKCLYLARLYLEVMFFKEKGGSMKKVGRIGILILAAALLAGCNKRAETADEPSPWMADYDAALKQAAAENKYVLVDFSGSDWCGWCIKLDEEVFSKPEFIEYAKANLICVLLDFPRGKELPKAQKDANQALLEKFQVQGFPTVLIFNPQGRLVKQTGYRPDGAAKYVEFIKGVIAAGITK
jgi:protein disulfide-isomerase